MQAVRTLERFCELSVAVIKKFKLIQFDIGLSKSTDCDSVGNEKYDQLKSQLTELKVKYELEHNVTVQLCSCVNCDLELNQLNELSCQSELTQRSNVLNCNSNLN